MKIRTQIVVLTLFIVTTTLVITALYILSDSEQSERRHMLAHLESVASIQKSRLQAIYKQNIDLMNLLGSRTQLRLSVAAFNHYKDEAERIKIQKIIEDAVSAIPSYKAIYVYGFNDEIISNTKNNGFKQEALSSAYELGKKSVQAKLLYKDEEGVLWGVFSGPLILNAEFVGVVVVVSSVENLLLPINDYSGLGETGETILAKMDADGDALFIAPTRFNKDAALTMHISKQQKNIPIINAIQGESVALLNDVDYRDVPILAVTKYLPELGWGLVVKIDKAEVYARLAGGLERLYFVLIFLCAVAMLMVIYWSKKITRPIEAIIAVAVKVAAGNYSIKVDPYSTGEVGLLTNSFNKMLENINRRNQQLMTSLEVLETISARFDRWKNSGLMGILRCDKEGFVLESNDYFLSLIGLSAEYLNNNSLNTKSITPKEYYLLDKYAKEELLVKDCWRPYEKEFIASNGRRIPVLIGGTYYDQKMNDEYLCFIVDLSAVSQYEARWQIALEGGNIGVWDWDIKGGSFFYSNVWRNIVGRDVMDEAVDWRELVHVDDRQQCLVNLNKHLNGESMAFISEHRLLHADGDYRWVNTKAKVTERLSDNSPARVIGVTEDVNKTKLAEIELSEHLQLDAMVSDVSSLLIKLSLDELELGMNEVAKKMGHYLSADMVSVFTLQDKSLYLTESFSWRSPGIKLPVLARKGFDLKLEFPWLYDFISNKAALFNLADVGELPEEAVKEREFIQQYNFKAFVLIPLLASNKLVGYVTCASTNEAGQWRELAVSFLLVLAESIGQLLERNSTNAELYRMQKMEAVGQLTGGIAHDFNNLLSIISGNLELLERQFAGNETALRRVSSAEKAAKRAAKLTKNLLAFSRKKVSEKSTVNINKAIVDLEQLFRNTLAHQVEIFYELDQSLWFAELDVGDFQDACLNLLINARDAMPAGGKVGFITTNITVDSNLAKKYIGLQLGDYVLLRVKDEGVGIKPAVIEHIFDPFFTTKKQGEGTGLGLSMVFGFVKRSGGCIDVKSNLGKGTEFYIFLPRAQKTMLALESEVNKNESLPKGNQTILVVDDEESLVELAAEYLQQQGYHVLTASRGAEALDQLAANSDISLLFTDILMPGGINGYQLAEQASLIYPDIKILLTSGYAEQKSFSATQEKFNQNLLAKPYGRKELIDRVFNMLALN